MDKIGIITVAYNEEDYISACINQFKNFNVLHLVLTSIVPWNGKALKKDKTVKKAKNKGATVFEKKWLTEHDQRNWGIKYLQDKGISKALIVDSDEYYTQESITKLINGLFEFNDSTIGPEVHNIYYKDTDHIVIGSQPHSSPIVGVQTDMFFTDVREMNAPKQIIKGTNLEHISYVRKSNKDMKKKLYTASHANEILDGWIQRCWIDWTPDTRDIHPTQPHIWPETKEHAIPREILTYFDE